MRVLHPARRREVKASYFRLLSLARVESLLHRLHSNDGSVLVLNLHRVSPQRNPYWAPMTPEAFALLVEHLVTGCNVLTFDHLTRPRPAAVPRVILSFDDGYRDFVEYAMPILDQHGVRANQNIIVQSVETTKPPWITKVVDALNAATTGRVRALRVADFDVRLRGDDEVSKALYGTLLTRHLKSLTPAAREAACEDLQILIDDTDPDRLTTMMSRADVTEVAAIHDVGAHSYSHEAMSLLSDAEFADDLDRCSAFLAELGCPMKIFAFPYGSFRAGQIEAVRARGVDHVLLVGERPAELGLGVYTRITMYGDSAAELQLRAMGHRVGTLRGIAG